ncbi:uncharacterized protein [Nicotiana tomentosiformis]|uniref:uncharacterized protein n=1 Tax=Nicotiana tomentosiformis TaxID=4098 RepID=UPI00388C7A40
MEYLSRSLKTMKDNKQFKFHPKYARVNLVQLGFADDLLLFCRGDMRSFKILHQHFQMFSAASSLIANPNKICIYFGSVSNLLQQQIMDILGYTKGELPFRYLGVPLRTKRLSVIQCEPLIERMLNMIQSWTTKFLSYAGRAVLVKKPKSASCVIQRIFKARSYFEDAGFTEEDVQKMEKYSVKQIYKAMHGEFSKMTWRKLVCNNQGLPKWIFILRLTIEQRLATKERLARWGIISEQTCSLCQRENETVHHLFFDCEISRDIWQHLLKWQGIQRTKKAWQEELTWLEQFGKGKSGGAAVCRMTIAAAVYHIWQEKNNVMFKKKRPTNAILRLIIQEMHVRATIFPRLD